MNNFDSTPNNPLLQTNAKPRNQNSRAKAVADAQAILQANAPAILRAAIDKALSGNASAMKLCIQYILRPRFNRRFSPLQAKIELAKLRDSV